MGKDAVGSVVFALIMMLGCIGSLVTQTVVSAETEATTSVHGEPVELPPVDESQAISFSQQPTYVGDRVVQRVGLELGIETKITQSGQIAHESNTQMRRRQERKVEVLEVHEGRVLRAKVSFPLSRAMSPEGPDPEQEEIQPVEGNSYLVTRIDDERLKVTDMNGSLPTRDEFELVVQSAATLGLPNPLAEFLLRRSIRVGEKLRVPQSLAREILGFDQLGEVKSFTLDLREIREVDDKQCAVFAANIEAEGDESSPLRINVDGEVVIEIATCRTVAASLTGPMTMHAAEEEFEYQADGSILVAIQARYGSKGR